MTSIATAALGTRASFGALLRGGAVVAAAVAAWHATDGWDIEQRLVLTALAGATLAWVVTRVDDTRVALVAVAVLALAGAVPPAVVGRSFVDPTIWLLVGSCALAAGVAASGLAQRAAIALVGGARSVRGLWHRTTIALVLTTFAVPATSGRAALALPVFRTIAGALPARHQRALSLLFPAVILLSAFASILGAGAHLVAASLVESATGTRISFAWWLLLGAPVALATCVVVTELVLVGWLSRADRALDVAAVAAAVRAADGTRRRTPSAPEVRALVTLVTVIALWATEAAHGIHPAIVAMVAGAITVLPIVGTTTPAHAARQVPWSLLVFLAATLALGTALVTSGAADRLAQASLGALGGAHPASVLLAIVVVSTLAHLVVQSRTARATVLLPVVLVVALGAGINPVAAALASTAAAGFCLTLTSSAKPVAMFASVAGVQSFDRASLLALAAMTAPVVVGTTLLAAAWLWPALGVPLETPAALRGTR
ncbi:MULTISPECIES: SLC13 family permease [unclassified Agrococcus]|uniref:SLC13 family permease n=1 Tax=unclassified Agrococcus TaxID=2615065 RepID=UPI00361E7184